MGKRKPRHWWGRFELPKTGSAHWRIGPLQLIVLRREGEWQVGRSHHTEWEEAAEEWDFQLDDASPEELDRVERFLFRRTELPLEVLPTLADRPVVSSPRVPITLLPGEETRLFVGSPVWVSLAAGDPPVKLVELPIRRPSDTWFGPSTRQGELCYATRTQAILRTENLPQLSPRAITPVAIRNQAPEALQLERLKLPVPLLSLYAGADGRLWTERIELERRQVDEMAAVEVRPGPPSEAPQAELVTPPRETQEPGTLVRVFSGLFGG